MERNKRRSRGQWSEIVGEQEKSGLSAKDFCTVRSIGLASFYQWRRRLGSVKPGAVGEVDSTESFIDMGQIVSSGVSARSGVGPWIVTLDLGGDVKLTLQRG